MSQVNPAAAGGGGDAFLQPQSMVTPGALGALTMVVTNSFAPLIAVDRRWTGLALAFLFGLVALVNSKSIVEKCVYYVLNSFIIFSIATGTNTVGVAAQRAAASPSALSWFLDGVFPSAFAADAQRFTLPIENVKNVQFFMPWFGPQPSASAGANSPAKTASPPAQEPLNLSPDSKNWSLVYGDFNNKAQAQDQAAKIAGQLGPKYQPTIIDQPQGGQRYGIILKKGLTLPQALDAQQDVNKSAMTKDTYVLNPDRGIAIGKPEG
jgi:hypothetical protein